ncbi:glucosyltransferase [Saitoella coloradoensis]
MLGAQPSTLLLRAHQAAAVVAFGLFQEHVPEPYMDEIFHIPQALRYIEGDYWTWDPKLTTPPGLYALSTAAHWMMHALPVSCHIKSILSFRFLNFLLAVVILPELIAKLYRRIHAGASASQIDYSKLIAAFPLTTFFGMLYYTDVPSTIAVLHAYLDALEKRRWRSALFSLASLTFRQTNVIWVAFVMFVSLLRDLQGEKEDGRPLLVNPIAVHASFPETYLKSTWFLARTAGLHWRQTIKAVAWYVPVLAAFVVFLAWNGGIVLGDKSNHIAGLHVPQLFYLAVFTAFFSFPIVLTPSLLPQFLRSRLGTSQKVISTALLLGVMLAAVHYNTREHPFILADNRHYVFYIWRRTIRAHALARYAAVPVYFGVIWLTLREISTTQSVLFMMAFCGATALTLIPSPLLEFRYFILPYLIWRLHIKPKNSSRSFMEYVWHEIILALTVWIFIYKPFEWGHVPGEVQRFMW